MFFQPAKEMGTDEFWARRLVRLLAVAVLATSLILSGQNASYAATATPPERADDNVIVAFYNIKWLGQTPHDLSKLSEVIKHFDICGVVEIKEEKKLVELAQTLRAHTGEDWRYVLGPRSSRPRGSYHESYAFLYRGDRVEIGDGITSNIWDDGEVYRNDPFFATFRTVIGEFTALIIHTRWSDDEDGSRREEVRSIPGQLAYLRDKVGIENLVVGGDFNYTASSAFLLSTMKQAKMLHVDSDDKTTFKRNFSAYANDYDHIFVSRAMKDMVPTKGRALDATQIVYESNTPASMRKSKSELSDHLPVFVVLTDGSDAEVEVEDE